MTGPTSTLRAVHERLQALCDWLDPDWRRHSPCPECGAPVRLHLGNYDYKVQCIVDSCDYAHHEDGYLTEANAWAAHEAWCREAREEDEG